MQSDPELLSSCGPFSFYLGPREIGGNEMTVLMKAQNALVIFLDSLTHF